MATRMDTSTSDATPVLMTLTKRTLGNIHPRARDRTLTLWNSAVTVNLNASLADAFAKLIEHNILCLPVVDYSNRVCGQIDMGMILEWIVQKFDVEPDLTTVEEFLNKKEEMNLTRVSAIMDDRNYFTENEKMSIYRAAEIMARNDAKRVIVTGWNKQVKGIFTQSMLIGEIFNNLHLLSKETRDMKVRDVTKSYWVSTVRDNSRVIDALRRMNNWGRTGLGVVDFSGKLVDQLTEKDLRGIGSSAESFMRLFKTVKEFKQDVRTTAGTKILKMPETVTEETTFEELIRLMDQKETHRVWVVDPRTQRPLYCITQTDIITQIFAKNAGGW